MKITIVEIIDDVVWLQFEFEGKAVFKETLASALRGHLAPQYESDKARGDGWNTDQAFRKMKIAESLRAELKRA